MNELNIDLLFSENKIHIGTEQSGYDSIPMKELGTSHDIETCKLMYDLHTESSLLQHVSKLKAGAPPCNKICYGMKLSHKLVQS